MQKNLSQTKANNRTVKQSKDLYIVTGGSKGLGAALVQNALKEKHDVVSISRTKNKSINNKNLIQIQLDLSKSFSSIEKKMDSLISKIDFKKINNLIFINNAAQIKPVSEVGKLNPAEIEKHIYLNYTIPVLLTNWLISKKTKQSGYLVIAQISSGAASFAIPNWSVYCSGKAALEMFNSVMQIQLSLAQFKKIKAFTYSPGIMDTDMQAVIRGLKPTDFPDVSRFVTYKKSKELLSPESVAQHLMKILKNPDKIKKATYSI